jgi:hypothetical protein
MWIMGCLIGHHETIARATEMKLCSMMKAVSWLGVVRGQRSEEFLLRLVFFGPYPPFLSQYTDRRVRAPSALAALQVQA